MVAPNWLWQDPLFLIVAKVSPQATKDQIPLVLQALLTQNLHASIAGMPLRKRRAGYRPVVRKRWPHVKTSRPRVVAVGPPAPANRLVKGRHCPNGQGR